MSGKVTKPAIDRFEAFSIPEPNSGCIIWMGSVNAALAGDNLLPLKSGKRSCRKCKNVSNAAYMRRRKRTHLGILMAG